MSRYYGKFGYSDTVEARPGVWEETIIEKSYRGDVTRNTRRLTDSQDRIIANPNVSMDVSIVADPYALQNFHKIKYITYLGSKWKINNVEVNFPRLILHIGDLYTEEEVENTDGQ